MIKSIHHICIETDRYSESLNFYCALLGFILIEETQNFHGREFNTWIKKENVIIELQTPKRDNHAFNITEKESFKQTGIAHVCFIVDDLPGTIDMLLEKGVSSFRKKEEKIIYRVKDGSLAKLTAPEGTIIELREE